MPRKDNDCQGHTAGRCLSWVWTETRQQHPWAQPVAKGQGTWACVPAQLITPKASVSSLIGTGNYKGPSGSVYRFRIIFPSKPISQKKQTLKEGREASRKW